MKKRTKKVLSFGVAALMAVSALPFSALSVSASIPTKQTENGGTPYNFLLEEQEAAYRPSASLRTRSLLAMLPRLWTFSSILKNGLMTTT